MRVTQLIAALGYAHLPCGLDGCILMNVEVLTRVAVSAAPKHHPLAAPHPNTYLQSCSTGPSPGRPRCL